jgi:hypothetical protein
VYRMAPGDALDRNGFGILRLGGYASGIAVMIVGAAVRDGVVIVIWPTAAGVDPNFFCLNYPLAELVGMVQ